MINVLFLDDQEERHKNFTRSVYDTEFPFPYTNVSVVQAYHADEAKGEFSAAISGQIRAFDVVFLDHDLGNGYPTGQEVADFIAALPAPDRPLAAVIHSWNPAGAASMRQTLADAGVDAYTWRFDELNGGRTLRSVLQRLKTPV